LGEEHRLRVFENRVLRKIFGPKREEDGSWRNLHNDELHDLYSSPNIVMVIKSWRMRWAGHVARMGAGRGAYRVLVGRPEGKRPLGRLRYFSLTSTSLIFLRSNLSKSKFFLAHLLNESLFLSFATTR
jgi:hypothetical protein